MSHPGDYLAKRMGRGRQCWGYCDKTPCRCSPRVRRFMRKAERQRVRGELRNAWQEAQERSGAIARLVIEASQ